MVVSIARSAVMQEGMVLSESGDKNNSKLKSSKSGQLMKRVSRACLHCRQRKSKCELDSSGNPGTPPCQRCLRDGRECVLGSSNRGGRRIRRNKIVNPTPISSDPNSTQAPVSQPLESPMDSLDHQRVFTAQYHGPEHSTRTHQSASMSLDDDDGSLSTAESPLNATVPPNPSDAWQNLTSVARRNTDGHKPENAVDYYSATSGDLTHTNGFPDPRAPGYCVNPGLCSYQLVQDGSLDRDMISYLVARYARHFHSHLPLVPRKYFDPAALDAFAASEKHLLTAILTVASNDMVDSPHIHEVCAKYMVDLISNLTRGVECDVEAVETLLIIAEWEPRNVLPPIEEVGRGEEDRAAWMHVGLAIRIGYLLGLDRTSFRGEPVVDPESHNRKRLAWLCCYMYDRLVSVRLGKAFWSRGPSIMSKIVPGDFPSLKPLTPADDDYEQVLKAMLKLTQLYNNVFDTLYSGRCGNQDIMLTGEYVKYVDDFRIAITKWKHRWKSLDCSPHLKMTLDMSYEYLRLYTNAFAFQAAIRQGLTEKRDTDAQTQREHLRAKFANVATMQDARFIYDSVEAAESYLNIVNDSLDPQEQLHYMPLRYYLYCIYAAVFLYKARSFGVLSQKKESEVREKVAKTIQQLRRTSVREEDTGCRYARLLELLWKPKQPLPTELPRQRPKTPMSLTALTNPEPEYMDLNQVNRFSWLDLGGVRDYISGDNMPTSGMLGMETPYQSLGPYSFDPNGAGYGFEVDPNGNLVF